jgi:hypothetical protein
MEYLAPMGHTITVPPGVLGTVERGIRGADEIFLVSHVRRASASDTKTDGNVDDLLVMDKMCNGESGMKVYAHVRLIEQRESAQIVTDQLRQFRPDERDDLPSGV